MILSLIKSVLATMSTPMGFVFGDAGWKNLKGDSVTFPAAFLESPIPSEDVFLQVGTVNIEYTVGLAFFNRSELRWTPEQHDEVIQEMRALRREFILRMNKAKDATGTKLIRQIKNVRTLEIMNEYDVNCTGVVFEFKVIPMSGDGICTLPVLPIR